MSSIQIAWALACVFIISSGQLLFKKAGIEIQAAGTWYSTRALVMLFCALAIYGIATLLWINLLRYVSLNKAYLFMALCFILVPIASHFFFREAITRGYVVGAALIISGLIVATRFG